MSSPENNNDNTSADKNAKLDFDAILEKGKIIVKAKVTKSENLHLNITSCGLSTDLVSCKPVSEHSPLNECGQQNVKVRKEGVFSFFS